MQSIAISILKNSRNIFINSAKFHLQKMHRHGDLNLRNFLAPGVCHCQYHCHKRRYRGKATDQVFSCPEAGAHQLANPLVEVQLCA